MYINIQPRVQNFWIHPKYLVSLFFYNWLHFTSIVGIISRIRIREPIREPLGHLPPWPQYRGDWGEIPLGGKKSKISLKIHIKSFIKKNFRLAISFLYATIVIWKFSRAPLARSFFSSVKNRKFLFLGKVEVTGQNVYPIFCFFGHSNFPLNRIQNEKRQKIF